MPPFLPLVSGIAHGKDITGRDIAGRPAMAIAEAASSPDVAAGQN